MEFPMHWLVILVVVLILFGGRKIPELMRDWRRRSRLQGRHERSEPAATAGTTGAELERETCRREEVVTAVTI